MKTLRQIRQIDGKFHLTIGEKKPMPTEFWTQDHFGSTHYLTPPVPARRYARSAVISPDKDRIWVGQHRFDNVLPSLKECASPEDWWGYVHDSWTVDLDYSMTIYLSRPESFKLEAECVLRRLSGCYLRKVSRQIAFVDFALSDAPQAKPFLDVFHAVAEEALEEEVRKSAFRTAEAKKTRARTKAGGNPRVILEGDWVLDPERRFSRGDKPILAYCYTRYLRGSRPRFYSAIDENGYGCGYYYPLNKRNVLKICPNAFEMIGGLSKHDQMDLMALQVAAEERRAKAKAQTDEEE